MIVKYINIDIYNAPTSNYNIDNMTKIGSSLMPVLIGTPAEISFATSSGQTMNYESLASLLATNLGVDVTSLVMPGYFASQQALDGFYHYGNVAPNADLIGFPLVVGSGRHIVQAIAEKSVYYHSCDNYPSIVLYAQTYYRFDGTTFSSNGPVSCCGNNATGNRTQCIIAVLRENNGIYDACGICTWQVTDDGTSGARYSFNCNNTSGNLLALFNSVEMIDEPTPGGDPYNPGGNSGAGGGTGNFDGTGDDIDIPGLPSLSATDTGFLTLFNPSAGELLSLANYMWSGAFDLDTFRKIFANPMDCILGLSIVPVSVPNGDTRTVTVGNISTGVSMTTAAQQYVEVDCGTLNVNEYWGAYLDYDPYTKAEIYLPYIGTHPLAVDDIMGKSVTVKYHVDILSGACTAFVKCGGSVLYEFIGQCSSSIPVSGNDWTNVINGVLTVAGAIGSMVATGGATAPMGASVIASTAVNSMKPNVEKSGSMSGTGGMLAVQTPYIILTRPRQALPANQNRYTGYPSFITRQLSDISGYTEIESIHLDGIPATEQELVEIENLLKGGVIL